MRVALSFLSSLAIHLATAVILLVAPQAIDHPADALHVDLPPLVDRTVAGAERLATETSNQPAKPSPADAAGTAKANTPKKASAEVRQAQAQLLEHLLYPPEAVRQGLEGETVLLLTRAADGEILSVRIARSSGHQVLDNAAVSAAWQLGRLRAGPAEPAELLLPVSFALE